MLNRLYFPISKDDDVALNVLELERMGRNSMPTMAADGYSATALGNGWHVFQQDPELYKKDITEHLTLVNGRTGQQIQIKLDIKAPKPRTMIDIMPDFDTFSSELEQIFTCDEDGYALSWQGLTKEAIAKGQQFHYMRIENKMFSVDAIRRLSESHDIKIGAGTGGADYTRFPEMAEECKKLISAYDAMVSTLKGVE
jgi:hypothetical protein